MLPRPQTMNPVPIIPPTPPTRFGSHPGTIRTEVNKLERFAVPAGVQTGFRADDPMAGGGELGTGRSP